MKGTAVTGAMLAQFLEARSVGSDCPACGTRKSMSISVYDPEGDLGGDAPAVNLLRHLPNESGMGFGEYLQACSNCGFLRYFRDIEVLAFFEGGIDNGG